MFRSTITKEEINALPVGSFEGKIFVIDSQDMIDDAVDYLLQHQILGMDTETKPTFKKGAKNINKVALLQFACDNIAFLFRINKIGLTEKIKTLLSNPAISKIGVAVHDDIKILQHVSMFEPRGIIDLQHFSRKNGIEHFGLKKLAAIVLGIKISKSQQLSNWENEVLSEAQLKYAATDAWLCYQIYNVFNQTKTRK